MKLRFLALLPLLSVAFSSQARAQNDSTQSRGADLFHDCQADIRLLDAPDAKSVSDSDFENSQFCAGYFTAFGDFIAMGHTSICVGEARLDTTIRVYVAYMDKHPKLMDDPMILGVVLALKESYPCPESKHASKPAPKP
jgi:hypothetical protein